MSDTRYKMQVTCNTCQYTGSIAAVELHSCDIQESGGRCEDYPCCGHTDGDGCQTLPSHTGDYYRDHPWLMYDPDSPEYYAELENRYGGR